MTDGQTAAHALAEQFLVEGDGADALNAPNPAEPAKTDGAEGAKPKPEGGDAQAADGKEAKDDAKAKPEGDGAGKAPVTPPAKASKRDRIQDLIRERDAANAFAQRALAGYGELRDRLERLEKPSAGETPEQAQERFVAKAVTLERANIVTVK